MSKAIVGVLSLAVVAAAASPYVIGMKVESEFRNHLAVTAELLEKNQIGFEIVDYQRGYLGATALVRYSTKIVNPPEETILEQTYQIHHGPVVKGLDDSWTLAAANIVNEVNLAQLVADVSIEVDSIEDLPQAARDYPPIRTAMVYDFTGAATWRTRAASLLIDNGDEGRLQWEGLDGEGSVDLQTAAGKMLLRSGSLTIVNADDKLTWGGFQITGDMSDRFQKGTLNFRGDPVLLTGDTKMEIRSLEMDADIEGYDYGMMLGSMKMAAIGVGVKSKDGQSISAKDLYIKTNSTQTDGVIDFAFTYGADRLEMSLEGVPNLEPMAFEAGFKMKGMDGETLEALMRELAVIDQTDTEQAQAIMFDEGLNFLKATLKNSPAVELSPIKVSMGDQSLQIESDAQLKDADAGQLLSNPGMAMAYLYANADIKVSRQMAMNLFAQQQQDELTSLRDLGAIEATDEEIAAQSRQAAQGVIGQYVQQGMIAENDGELSAKVRYSPQSGLQVNGLTIPLGQ